jgi:Fur family zinc uptake transcriptional regulator
MTSKATTINKGRQPLGFAQHNHGACMSEALAAAEARCAAGGLRFTPVRRKVLEILLQDHRALGAYSILDRLREEGFGSQPPVAYRALDFLVANGLAHRLRAHPPFPHASLYDLPVVRCGGRGAIDHSAGRAA